MFQPSDIIYEDNHLLVVNKRCGDLVQPDPNNTSALEDQIKDFIKVRDNKPGAVFLGVVHRIDRPVSGVVLFTKSSKALVRMNEKIRNKEVSKRYWAVVEQCPREGAAAPGEWVELLHHIVRDTKTNRSKALNAPRANSKDARLNYKVLGASKNYTLLEIELITGRHHQIRAQLSAIGVPIKGDLKYGAKRSNPGGGISLHSRVIAFAHPVTKAECRVVAPTPSDDSLWSYFEQSIV